MKTSTFPSLRVEPELREAAESVLREGETLTSLIEISVRETIRRRRIQEEFIARGLRSCEDTQQTGTHHAARQGLLRLFDFVIDRARTAEDFDAAQTAIDVTRETVERSLSRSPFVYRKAGDSPFLRELLITFGSAGYVALYEIGDATRVMVLAVRHHLEDDHH